MHRVKGLPRAIAPRPGGEWIEAGAAIPALFAASDQAAPADALSSPQPCPAELIAGAGRFALSLGRDPVARRSRLRDDIRWFSASEHY